MFVQTAAALERGVENPPAYLHRAAQFLLADELKRRDRETPYGELADDDPEVEERILVSRTLPLALASFPASFDSAVRRLTEDERGAFILTDLRGLTLREAGEVLGVSHESVRTRRDAAVSALRREIPA